MRVRWSGDYWLLVLRVTFFDGWAFLQVGTANESGWSEAYGRALAARSVMTLTDMRLHSVWRHFPEIMRAVVACSDPSV